MIHSLNQIARHRTDELMDQPDLPEADHQLALKGLARLNRFTGVAKQMFATIRKLAMERRGETLRVLDVASGSADLPIDWAKRAARAGLSLQITTADISPVAVQTQAANATRAGVDIHPVQLDCLNQTLPGEHDLVTCSLFMHHLDEPDVVKLITAMNAAATRQVLICDLERSRLNLGLVAIGAHALSRSHVVHADASMSVRGAYTVNEFRNLCSQAVGRDIPVRRVLPCRLMATWRTDR